MCFHMQLYCDYNQVYHSLNFSRQLNWHDLLLVWYVDKHAQCVLAGFCVCRFRWDFWNKLTILCTLFTKSSFSEGILAIINIVWYNNYVIVRNIRMSVGLNWSNLTACILVACLIRYQWVDWSRFLSHPTENKYRGWLENHRLVSLQIYQKLQMIFYLIMVEK